MKSADGWLERAAAGHLPEWTEAKPSRRAHMERVAELMGAWARARGGDERERVRWFAAGMLHDVLRDAPLEHLTPWVPPDFRHLPEDFLHGPAAAERLAREGVEDDGVLEAIRFHTLGSPGLGTVARALIAADFLEPGRADPDGWRAAQRARMPGEFESVLKEVVRARLRRSLDEGAPLRPEMVALWNELAEQ